MYPRLGTPDLAYALKLLENFPPWTTASVIRHSTHCFTKSQSNWLQP